jgi:hypothetical protein
MENINKGIAFTRNVPQNKWDRAKYFEIYENRYKEALERLDKFKSEMKMNEQKFIERGVAEIEIENWKFGQTNEHIQLLERVIEAKKHIEWLNKGLRELTYEKITLLEAKALQ